VSGGTTSLSISSGSTGTDVDVEAAGTVGVLHEDPVMGVEIWIRDQSERGRERTIIRKWRHIRHNSSSWMVECR